MAITSLFATFDSVQLTSITGVSILGTDPYKSAKRKLSRFSLARTTKSKTTSAYFKDKDITIRVAIQRANRGDTEQSHDSLIAILQGIAKDLVLSQSGGVRRYVATLSDVNYLVSGGAYIEMELIFSLDDPYGYDTAYKTALSISGVTSSTRADAVPFLGSADWQQPLIVIQYSALSGGSAKTLLVGNNNTGQQISITRTFSAGDRVEIDSANQTVKVNGSEVAYTGAFPEFAGNNTVGNWTYSDNFTSRTFAATITYYPRWA